MIKYTKEQLEQLKADLPGILSIGSALFVSASITVYALYMACVIEQREAINVSVIGAPDFSIKFKSGTEIFKSYTPTEMRK